MESFRFVMPTFIRAQCLVSRTSCYVPCSTKDHVKTHYLAEWARLYPSIPDFWRWGLSVQIIPTETPPMFLCFGRGGIGGSLLAVLSCFSRLCTQGTAMASANFMANILFLARDAPCTSVMNYLCAIRSDSERGIQVVTNWETQVRLLRMSTWIGLEKLAESHSSLISQLHVILLWFLRFESLTNVTSISFKCN